MEFKKYLNKSLDIFYHALEQVPNGLRKFLVNRFLTNLVNIDGRNPYSKTYLDDSAVFLLSLKDLTLDYKEISRRSEELLDLIGEDYQKIIRKSKEGLYLLDEISNIDDVIDTLSNGSIDYKIKKLVSKGFVPTFSFPFLWIGRLVYTKHLDKLPEDLEAGIYTVNIIYDVNPSLIHQNNFYKILPSILGLYDSLEENKNIVKSYTSLIEKLIENDFYIFYNILIDSKFNCGQAKRGLYSIVASLLVYYSYDFKFHMDHPLIEYIDSTPSKDYIKSVGKKILKYLNNKNHKKEELDNIFFDLFKLSLQCKKVLIDPNFEHNLPILLLRLTTLDTATNFTQKPTRDPPNFYI